MSVDVFGRNLEQRGGGSRGPPGVGFKLTSEGDYDLDNKKLCNIANATRMDDAVNLRTLYRLRTVIFQEFNTKTSGLEKYIKELEDRTDNIEEKIKRYGDDITVLTSIIQRIAKKLDPMDLRIDAPEKND